MLTITQSVLQWEGMVLRAVWVISTDLWKVHQSFEVVGYLHPFHQRIALFYNNSRDWSLETSCLHCRDVRRWLFPKPLIYIFFSHLFRVRVMCPHRPPLCRTEWANPSNPWEENNWVDRLSFTDKCCPPLGVVGTVYKSDHYMTERFPCGTRDTLRVASSVLLNGPFLWITLFTHFWPTVTFLVGWLSTENCIVWHFWCSTNNA